jgi:tRNA dimethylallyltransferase
MRCVGYKQMAAYLQGQVTYQEMKQQAIAATRQLAKRQHTWLRKWPDLTILAMDEVQQEHMVNNILRKIR